MLLKDPIQYYPTHMLMVFASGSISLTHSKIEEKMKLRNELANCSMVLLPVSDLDIHPLTSLPSISPT